jgi:2-dehydro-3-deoxygluconokinase
MNIAFVGECMIELRDSVATGIRQHFSGDTLNAAVYFCRQAGCAPLHADFITAIGTDRFSEGMLQFWRRENIGCGRVRRLQDKVPGLYFITVDATGERSFTYWRSDSAARAMFTGTEGTHLLNALASYDGVYLSGITLAILANTSLGALVETLAAFRKQGGKVFFDNNFRPALWPDRDLAGRWFNRVLELCDIAFLTLEDENLLFATPTPEAILQRCANLGIRELVIKCGREPCIVRHQEQVFSIPAVPAANIVDTTAAGDAFSGAYLAERLKGETPANAAVAAHKVAARVIGVSGAFGDLER